MTNTKSSKSYQTKQKAIVLQYLQSHPRQCVTIEEIYHNLILNDEKIGKTTIYRALAKLVAENLVTRYHTEKSSGACFQYKSPCCCQTNHIHLKCLSCGELFHLDCDFVQKMEQHFCEEHAFQLDYSQTVLYGLCRQCAKE